MNYSNQANTAILVICSGNFYKNEYITMCGLIFFCIATDIYLKILKFHFKNINLIQSGILIAEIHNE
jgi:hypothetical protein